MILSRRKLFKVGAAAVAEAVVGKAIAKGQPRRSITASVTDSRPVASHRTPLDLPDWKYGSSSFADDTVLMFRGNPSHTFYGTGTIPEDPQLLWSYRMSEFRSMLRGKSVTWTGTGWTGQPAQLGRYVFVGSTDTFLYALDADSGQVGWRLGAGRMFKGSVCVFENRIYVGNTDNYLRCIDAATGREVWRFYSGADLDSSPCVVDGKLFITGENGYARCIDPRTGTLIWQTYIGGTGPDTPPGSNGSETSPAVDHGEFYAATYDGLLVSLDSRNGKVRWEARTGDDTDASPVLDKEYVYTAAEDKASFLYCFRRKDGREIWRYSGNHRGYWSTPAVMGGRIYVGGYDSRLHCVDGQTGQAIWRFAVGGPIWSSPAVVDDKVVFGSYDGNLYIVDADTGRQLWSHHLGGRCISTPCIVDGRIYIGTATGWFHSFGK